MQIEKVIPTWKRSYCEVTVNTYDDNGVKIASQVIYPPSKAGEVIKEADDGG